VTHYHRRVTGHVINPRLAAYAQAYTAQKLSLSSEAKTAGNEAYRAENWTLAIDQYTRALDAIMTGEADQAGEWSLCIGCHVQQGVWPSC
jgi:DNA-binding FadR family transcriptional regulator